MRNSVSFTPLMRSTVGFDRFNDLFQSLIEGTDTSFDTYPPYNIEKRDDDQYRIVMAVAGFTLSDLNIVAQRDTLVVTGKSEEKSEAGVTYLHRGIGARSFQRTFRLADHIKVTGAEMQDGLLSIHLVHEVPEEAKPRMIEINGGSSSSVIENDSPKTLN